MAEKVYEARLERVVRGDPDLVWAILSDTNRFDRGVGLNPSTYDYGVAGDPPSRQRIGFSTYRGTRFKWIEVGEWEEGKFFWGERRFLRALLLRCGLAFEVERVDQGSRVNMRAYAIPRAGRVMGRVAALHWKRVFTRTLRRYLDELERVLATPASPDDERPASSRARQVLACAAPQPFTNGRTSPVDAEALGVRAARLEGVAGPIADRIVELLRDRPDEAVTAMRPFQLARAWGADPREVLRGFLQATRAGLVDLGWQLNCPVCRVGAGNARTLADVARRVHCDECDISFDNDFAANVEAVFNANAAIRPVRPEVYCAGTPFVRPHVYALYFIEPGAARELKTRPAGALLVRALGRQRQLHVAADARVEIAIGDDALTAAPSDGALRIVNRSAVTTTVLVERSGVTTDVVRGTDLITVREFHDLFGAEAPAAGNELAVGTLCLVFTDVVGSTSLYERIGETGAYALVQEHFRIAHELAGEHDGSVVKTLGDGMMMCFVRPDRAVAAALRLAAHARELGAARSVEFAIRVGVHQGPCYVVRANDRLDLFGTSVNVAARLCRVAAPNQVVTSVGLLEHDSVHEVLARAQSSVRRLQSELKGFSTTFHVAAIDQPRP